MLSDSNTHLALDEIYHQLCAPIQRNVTHGKHTVHERLQATRGILTLDDALFQEAYTHTAVGCATRDHNSRPQCPNSHAEHPPVHSPLLRESCLVSLAPLTYMLKFGGFACLNSCLGGGEKGGGVHTCALSERRKARLAGRARAACSAKAARRSLPTRNAQPARHSRMYYPSLSFSSSLRWRDIRSAHQARQRRSLDAHEHAAATLTDGRSVVGTEAGTLSRKSKRAQHTFKSLLIRGNLQFKMLIALRYALHRCSSRDIRR